MNGNVCPVLLFQPPEDLRPGGDGETLWVGICRHHPSRYSLRGTCMRAPHCTLPHALIATGGSHRGPIKPMVAKARAAQGCLWAWVAYKPYQQAPSSLDINHSFPTQLLGLGERLGLRCRLGVPSGVSTRGRLGGKHVPEALRGNWESGYVACVRIHRAFWGGQFGWLFWTLENLLAAHKMRSSLLLRICLCSLWLYSFLSNVTMEKQLELLILLHPKQ